MKGTHKLQLKGEREKKKKKEKVRKSNYVK